MMKKSLLLLISFIVCVGISFGQSSNFSNVQKLGEAARRVSRGTVPAIVKMVNEGWNLLNQAIATNNSAKATLAAAIFDKAIKLARVEHFLRREQRKTIRRLQQARQHVKPGSGRSAVSSLRQAETLLASIRQTGAFFHLKHGFIRRTLRLINQKIKQVERKSPQEGAKLQDEVKHFETLFQRAQGRVQSTDNGLWAKLRRADNKYRRALVAIRSERFDVASRLLKDAIRTLERLVDNRHNPLEEKEGSPLLGGTEPKAPLLPSTPNDNALSQACQKAVSDVEQLRSSVASAVGESSVGRALVGRADRLVSEARTLSRKGNYRDAIKKVSLADRLYKRASQVASSTQSQ